MPVATVEDLVIGAVIWALCLIAYHYAFPREGD